MFSVNGCGTVLKGKKEDSSDGSFEATKWFTIFLFPIFPLGTYRIKKIGKGTNWVYYKNQDLSMLKIATDWKHIKKTYFKYYGIVVFIIFLMYLSIFLENRFAW